MSSISGPTKYAEYIDRKGSAVLIDRGVDK
jgi:hypothetical protein